jgi:hypothetical protein
MKGFRQAGDNTSTALQAAVRFGKHVAILVESVDFRGAYEKAVFRFAFGSADLLVYLNVPFLVHLEDVLSEFFFYLQVNLHSMPSGVPTGL